MGPGAAVWGVGVSSSAFIVAPKAHPAGSVFEGGPPGLQRSLQAVVQVAVDAGTSRSFQEAAIQLNSGWQRAVCKFSYRFLVCVKVTYEQKQ